MPMGAKKSRRLLFELWAPFCAAVVVFVVLVLSKATVVGFFAHYQLNAAGLFASIFDWASIQTGFLFGVYGFVVGKAEGFIAEVKSTKAMVRFVRYTGRATIIGFLLTACSMPLIVASPSVANATPTTYYLLCLWFALFVWGFFAFLRVAYIFGIIVRPKEQQLIPG